MLRWAHCTCDKSAFEHYGRAGSEDGLLWAREHGAAFLDQVSDDFTALPRWIEEQPD